MSLTVLPDPADTPRRCAHVFLSYASEDRPLAVWLHDRLIEAGAGSVWLDRKNIEGGDDWKSEIRHGLLNCNLLLALLTDAAADERRFWIQYEHREAARLLRHIIPLRFRADMPPHLSDLQYVDFVERDRESAFLALLNAIGKHGRRDGRRLPAQTPPLEHAFVGREEELQRINRLLQGGELRVSTARRTVAIQGMGGLGKTMIAYELVRRLASHYPGGVLLETRGQTPTPAHLVLQRWAGSALGKTPDREYQEAEVRALLGTFGELLVLVDDVPEPDFQQTRTLLSALPPDATRLITTRSMNAAAALGCVLFPLGRLSESDGIALVRDRLHARLRERLDPAEFTRQFEQVEDSLRELISRVEGHPLALELAAGRCDVVADVPEVVSEILGSLDRGVDHIRTHLAWDVSRNSSVAVSLDASLEELRRLDQLRRTQWADRFIALGVFPDGARIDREMIFAAWGVELSAIGASREALSALHQRSLVNRDERTGHYSLHPLLRAFAHQLLCETPERLAEIQRRYWRIVIEEARQGFSGPVSEWQQRLKIQFPHIRALGQALLQQVAPAAGDVDRWSAPEGRANPDALAGAPTNEPLELALDFALVVAEYVIRRPTLADHGRRILALGLAAARRLERHAAEVACLRALGGWHAKRDPATARRYFEAALSRARALGNLPEEGAVLSYLGELERNCSRFQQACDLLDQALRIHRGLQNRRMEATTLKYLGETHWRLANYETALACYREALAITQDRAAEGDLFNKVGSVAFATGNLESAIPFFEQALEIHREVGDMIGEATDLNDLGIASLYMGRVDGAMKFLETALPIHRQVENRNMEAITLSNLSAAGLARGEWRRAGELADAALEIARDIHNRVTESWALAHRGQACQALGRLEEALACYETAVANLRQVNNPRGLAGCLGYLAVLLGDRFGRAAEAASLASEAVTILERSGTAQAFGGRRLEEFRRLVDRYRNSALGTGDYPRV